mmetsp:Transcript_5252/g.12646  ORF Transcript_5252/g.12646 Transcript_5252/m.12646 type:complete len:163 (-) Transcript_5252:100-588(-)
MAVDSITATENTTRKSRAASPVPVKEVAARVENKENDAQQQNVQKADMTKQAPVAAAVTPAPAPVQQPTTGRTWKRTKAVVAALVLLSACIGAGCLFTIYPINWESVAAKSQPFIAIGWQYLETHKRSLGVTTAACLFGRAAGPFVLRKLRALRSRYAKKQE